jgi:hypothetical protein
VSASVQNYNGGTFDGRYVYYAPNSSQLMRYDTQSNAFTTQGSWLPYDATQVDPAEQSFQGAVFDGHYVYYVPSQGTKLLRYDPQLSFTDKNSYLVFDIGSVDHITHGFEGATFDGKYIYFSPWYASGNYQSIAFRYDTTKSMTDTASWESYDVSNKDIGCEGYFGVVFDGRYVSFVPLRHQSNANNGLVVRFDTQQASFSDDNSWTLFDTKTVVSGAAGYAGAAFDGNYLYFVGLGGTTSRYDTALPFGDTGSWTPYATTNVTATIANMEFGGFDGKYIFLGSGSGTTIGRVDPTGTFDSTGPWKTFDISTLTPAGGSTGGMIYDGRYMYFPPSGFIHVSARFDTKSVQAMPQLPQFHGSFY